MSTKTIGFVVFNELATAELSGAAEAFTQAHLPTDYGCECHCYKLVTIGLTTEPCFSRAGIMVKPDTDFQSAPELDTLIVCGGEAIRAPTLCKKVAKWLNYRAPTTRRIATLGTGIYALAMTGLLDGREVATHWRFAKDVAIRFPQLRVHANRLFVKDGPFYTCAGGTAAVDFSLSLIEADFGRSLALKLARELVVHLKRLGREEQYSQPLQFQTQASDRFADIASWILCNLGEDLSGEALAARACMSRRNFDRQFTQTFGKTPAEFVAGARMTEARRRLLIPRTTLESIATSLGFKNVSVFSTSFERFVGMRPSTYRTRLGVQIDHRVRNGSLAPTKPERARYSGGFALNVLAK
jgi:transcriptional regulator GlxA family with amidase domain